VGATSFNSTVGTFGQVLTLRLMYFGATTMMRSGVLLNCILPEESVITGQFSRVSEEDAVS